MTETTNRTRMSVRLRRADEDDADAIGDAHVAVWREAYAGLMPSAALLETSPQDRAALWRRVIGDGHGRVWVAADASGTVLGFVSSGLRRNDDGDGEIQAINVRRHARRRGLGAALFARAGADLTDLGAAQAGLWVLEQNAAARAFYERLGGVAGERRVEPIPGGSVVERRYRVPLAIALPG